MYRQELAMMTHTIQSAPLFHLRFHSLFHEGRGYSFPCDAAGQVVLDELSECARRNYLCARAMVGRDYAPAVVTPS
jgi:hypothetical protein